MTQEPTIGNLSDISIFDSMAAEEAHAGKSTAWNRITRQGWKVCAKWDTFVVCASRPMWARLRTFVWSAVQADVTPYLSSFHGFLRQIAKTDLPREKTKTRSMNRDIGTR